MVAEKNNRKIDGIHTTKNILWMMDTTMDTGCNAGFGLKAKGMPHEDTSIPTLVPGGIYDVKMSTTRQGNNTNRRVRRIGRSG